MNNQGSPKGEPFLFNAPAVDVPADHCSEQSVLDTVVVPFEGSYEFLGSLPIGMTVGRTGGAHHRKTLAPYGSAYVLLGSKNKGTYDCELLVLKERDRRIAPYPSLGEKIHYEGLHRVVVVVTESDFVAAKLSCRVMEGSAPHSRAKTAWVRLFSYVKDYLADLRGDNAVFDAQTGTKLGYCGIIAAFTAKGRINSESHDVVVYADKAPKPRKTSEQHKTVLAAGYPHCYSVAVAYHVVLLYRFSHMSKNFLHFIHLSPLVLFTASL